MEKLYVVMGSHQRYSSQQNYYTDSRDDAEEKYNMMCKERRFVEILFGTPGHYETIKKSY